MKMKWFSLALLTFAGLLIASAPASAQGPMAQPGPEHEWLKKFEGEWTCTMHMMGSEHPAKCSSKIELNGFYLCSTFEGDIGGMKFTGRNTVSYCPVRKKYMSTWIDSMSPSMMIMEGKVSNDGKTFTEIGEGPNHEGKMSKFKSVTQLKDADTMHFTMYEVVNGQENEMFTIDYKRKK